ncbi:MAG: type II toxin-antitoxin system RelE/ParE family toxin [Vicinamibacterales bacterium]
MAAPPDSGADARRRRASIQIDIYSSRREKPLVWLGASLDDIRAFPAEARRAAGHQLGRVRQGLEPTDWKPMSSVGSGVIEIRIHTRLEHRVFYVAKFDDAVYVLHAFEKRTRATPRRAIELARSRMAELLTDRAKVKQR